MRRALVVLLLAGCFNPNLDYPEGTVHCAAGEACPPDYVCRDDGFCWRSPDSPDAAEHAIDAAHPRADAARGPDAEPVDGPEADGPTVDAARGPVDARAADVPMSIADARPGPDAARPDGMPQGNADAAAGGRDAAVADGPTPTIDACVAADPCPGMCGDVLDDCGRTVNCGDTCMTQEFGYTCGGAVDNVCGCTPTNKWCDGNVLKSCNAGGTWDTIQSCPTVCAGGQCGACTPTSRECVDSNTYHVCKSDGTWNTTNVDCPGGQICDPADGQCKSCLPGTHQCSSCTQPQTCQAGAWVDDAQCTTNACNAAGGCTGVCAPDSTRCKIGSTTIEQTCSCTGAWGSDKTCTYVCTGGACGGMCHPGDKTCNGSELRTCDSTGTYQDTQACTFGCSAASCNVCTPSSRFCSQDGKSCLCSADGKSMTCSAVCGSGCNANGCCNPSCSGVCDKDVNDSCGNPVHCPDNCVAPQTCGGGSMANVCGCTPSSDPCATHCGGSWPNGCGNVTCPNNCVSPQTCGGGGVTNVCGCTPSSDPCASHCSGSYDNGCGTVNCSDNCAVSGKVCYSTTCCTPSDPPCGLQCNVDLSRGCGLTKNCPDNCASIDPNYTCGGYQANVCGCPDTAPTCSGSGILSCSGGVVDVQDCGGEPCCDCGALCGIGCAPPGCACQQWCDCQGSGCN